MKVAIYGDSFGCASTENIADVDNYSWPYLLRKNPAVTFLGNYSEVGKSFINTYYDFLTHKHKYNVNIFLVTKLGRIDFPELHGICKSYFTNKTEIYLIRRAIEDNAITLTEEQKIHVNKLLDYADLYFDVGRNLYYENLSRTALLEQAKRFSEYTIFIPCFEGNVIAGSPCPLVDIFDFENVHLKINELNEGQDFGLVVNNRFLNDTRQCHLSQENNKILLDKILQAINIKSTTIDLNVRDFKIPTGTALDYCKWEYLDESTK